MVDRLQKILASRGVASRRHAETLIQAGRVSCNGKICVLGDKADPQRDLILVDGKPLPSAQEFVYIMLNKPRGYVTTLSDEKGRKDVSALVADCGMRVYPVGRLDMDSEGLLIFTNDGEFANLLMHPKHNLDKVYYVWVRDFTPTRMEALRRPVDLDGYRIRPPKVRFINNFGDQVQLEITIHEGRNRQIRRMCAIAGMKVIRLQRVQEGSLQLGALELGKWRYLTASEVSELKK